MTQGFHTSRLVASVAWEEKEMIKKLSLVVVLFAATMGLSAPQAQVEKLPNLTQAFNLSLMPIGIVIKLSGKV